jgi:hypothetical protein
MDSRPTNPVKTKLLERLAHHMMAAAEAARKRKTSKFRYHLKKARPIAVEIGHINGHADPENMAPVQWIDSYLQPLQARGRKDQADAEKN